MLGKLATWLRIAGYDTLYIADLAVEKEEEDHHLAYNHEDRILLTKDKELFNRAKSTGRKVILLKSNSVAEQMKEVEKIGVKFKPVMDRCSVCNELLRKPSNEEKMEVLRREGIKEDLAEKYELWYCEKCRKLYWMGSHWENMIKFLNKHSIRFG
jgi:hypothetical protein